MFDRMLKHAPGLKKRWHEYEHLFSEIDVPAKHVLLREGEIPRKVFFVRKGCLRASLDNHGKDITFMFFFEGDVVASIESFRSNQPSPISILSIEPSTIVVLPKSGFEILRRDFPELKDLLLELALRRFTDYTNLFISHLKDTPQERYTALLKDKPEIVQRVPQHYIASYLGITPVSLSRIRKRI